MRSTGGTELKLFHFAILVTFMVAFGSPAQARHHERSSISANPASLSFSAAAGGTATLQSVNINSPTGASVTFTVSANQPWITISSTSVSTTSDGAVLQVGVSPGSLAAGSYSGDVVLTNSEEKSSQIAIPVTLTLTAAPSAPVAPSIASQPASQTVVAGKTAAFAVVATGTSPMTYQWSKNGAAISGATSSSYTTPAETSSNNTAQFTVMVSNSAGNATSKAATLTVTPATLILNSSSTSLSFGNVNIASSGSQEVTLTNAGTSTITISNVTIAGAGFNTTGVSSGLMLSPGQTATVTATFSPATAGSSTGSVTVASNATNSPDTIALAGTGVAAVTHSVSVTWTRSTSTVIGYNTYAGTTSGGPYTKLTPAPVASTSYTDSEVQAGQTYYYVVTSVNSANEESAYSVQTTATIP